VSWIHFALLPTAKNLWQLILKNGILHQTFNRFNPGQYILCQLKLRESKTPDLKSLCLALRFSKY
jgi:hypothetical protein